MAGSRRSFEYQLFPPPSGTAGQPPLQPQERVYVWQWGRAQRANGHATVLSCSEGAAEEDEAPPCAAEQQQQRAQQRRSSECRRKRLQRQRVSSQAPGWQPEVPHGKQGRSVVRYADGTTASVRNGRITRVMDATVESPKVVITPDTATWRQLARSQLNGTDEALDIGCSFGGGTAVIAEHCRGVIGIDIGRAAVERAALAVPAINASFVCFDVLRHPERLAAAAAGRSVIFADIGGNRELEALATLLPRLEGLPSPIRLIVIKSKSLYQSALQWRVEQEDSPVGSARVGDSNGFLLSLAAAARLRLERQNRARQARAARVALRQQRSQWAELQTGPGPADRALAQRLVRAAISSALCHATE